ncbi:MAG: hypothetical protein C4521_09185, partial [Actinobacteria bacterium]
KSDTGAVSEAVQAQYIGEAYKRLFEEFPYVDALLIYNMRDNGTGTGSWHNFGLLRRDFSRKPGHAALGRAALTSLKKPLISASRNHILRGSTSSIGASFPDEARGTRMAVESRALVGGQWEEMASTIDPTETVMRLSVAPTSTTEYRAIFGNEPSLSRSMRIYVHPPISLSAPWLGRTTVPRDRVFSVYGYRRPRSDGRTRLYFYRLVVRRWNGRVYKRWRFCATGYARNYDYAGITRYRYAFRLSTPGVYYVRATAYYDYPNRCGTTGPARLFYVR